MSLASFVTECPLQPLNAGQSRHMLQRGEIPDWAFEKGQLQRACIEEASGDRVLELRGFDMCRVLHVCSDQGSIGWPTWYYLFTRRNLFGTFSWDPHHRTWGDVKNAIKASDLFVHLLTAVMVYNISSGPWDGAAFFSDLRGAAAQFFANESIDSPFFTMFYENMSKDMGMYHQGSFGTRGHMQEVFDSLKRHDMLRKKGQKVKLSRWFSVFDKAEEFNSWWSGAAMLLCYMMVTNGVVAGVGALPAFGARFARLAIEPPSATPIADIEGAAALPSAVVEAAGSASASSNAIVAARPRDVRHSNEAVDQLRRKAKYKNQLHMGASVLSDAGFRRVLNIMRVGAEPTRVIHKQTTVQLKTKRGCIEYCIGNARQDWISELLGITSVFQDIPALEAMDFDCSPYDPNDECDLEEDLQVADLFTRFMFTLLGIRLMTNISSSHSLPFAFCGLLDPDSEKAGDHLELMEHWWTVLEAAEMEAHSTPHVRSS